MSEESADNHSGFWTGIIIGGLVGAGIAYFINKDKNGETRKLLQKKGKWILDSLGGYGREIIREDEKVEKEVVSQTEDLQKQAEKTAEQVEKKIDEVKQEAQKAIEKVTDAAQDAITDVNKSAEKLEKTAEKTIDTTHKSFKKFFYKGGKSLAKK